VSVYKPCDIRGLVDEELNPALYRRWGALLGGKADPGSAFVVGGDVRPSTPAYLEAFARGLADAGVRVIDLGVVPTPMVYFAKRAWNVFGCAVVTASHSPPDMNGLKWMAGEFPPREKDVARLERETESSRGKPAETRPGGFVEKKDAAPEYEAWLRSAFPGSEEAPPTRIVVDPGNGCWAGRAAPILRKLLPDLEFETIYDEPDGTFPERRPDSANPRNLRVLRGTVRDGLATLGIGFDGDGDRVSFVDGEGNVLSPEEAVTALLACVGDGIRARRFVYDIKFSDRIPEMALARGGEPLVERSGHAFIRRRMVREDAIFGAEVSGHYFWKELEGGDDGLFTACRLILHLARTGESLAALRKTCPPVFITQDYRVPLPADRHEPLFDEIRSTFSDFPQVSVDGVRVVFHEGWALVRSSVTEDGVTLRFEGNTAENLDQTVEEFCERVPVVGNFILDVYRPRGKS